LPRSLAEAQEDETYLLELFKPVVGANAIGSALAMANSMFRERCVPSPPLSSSRERS